MTSNVLIITMQQQKGPNWCYSSVIQSIVRYYNKRPNNTRLNQRNIASIVAGNTCINGMQDPYYFLHDRGYIAGLSTKKLTWDVITQQIDAGFPIILLVGEHYIILYGYNGNGYRDPNRKLYFLDPLLPTGKHVELNGSEFVNNGFPTDYKQVRFQGRIRRVRLRS